MRGTGTAVGPYPAARKAGKRGVDPAHLDVGQAPHTREARHTVLAAALAPEDALSVERDLLSAEASFVIPRAHRRREVSLGGMAAADDEAAAGDEVEQSEAAASHGSGDGRQG